MIVGPTMPTPTNRRGAPTIAAGWVYLIHTWDDPRMYVGQSARPPFRRVNEERRTMPWGPDIKPGREGYTILRRVESSGDPTIDAILLDLAEAEEIRRLNPTDNRNRPDPAVFVARLAAARAGTIVGDPWGTDPFGTGRRGRAPRSAPRRAPRQPRRTTPTGRVPDRGGDPWVWLKAAAFVALSALSVIVALPVAQAWPNPTAPWVIVPVAAVLGPVGVALAVRRAFGRAPVRRRRRRR